MRVNREVPLTDEQRNWLRVNALLPTLFITALLIVIVAMFAFVWSTGAFAHPLVKVFTALSALLVIAVCIAVFKHVRNNRADLKRGTATIVTERLVRKHRTDRSPYTFYAEFEHAGQVIVMGDVYETLVENETYDVTFSPRTKKAWAVSA